MSLLTSLLPGTDGINMTGNVTELLADMITTEAAPVAPPRPTRILPQMLWTFRVAEKLGPISKFVLFAVGTLGNGLSFAVLCRKGMRVSTSSVYLRFLAISDFLTVWAYFMVMLAKFYEPHLHSKWFCKMFFWFESSFQQISSYLVIAMTAERYFAVAFPLSVGRIFTKHIAYGLSVGIYITFLTINSVHLVFVETYKNLICIFDNQNKGKLIKAWSKADSSIAAYIPATLILILNVLIIVQVKKAKRGQQKMMGKTKGKAGNNKVQDQIAQITRMLLTVSIAYWILNMPMAIFFAAHEYFFNYKIIQGYAESYFVQQICIFLMLTNNSINFFLYCLTGKRFRHEFQAMICCKESHPPGASRVTSTMSTNTAGNTKMVSVSQVNINTDANPTTSTVQ